MSQKNYSDLPYHAISGVVLTGLFWLICSFVSVTVSGAILVVPAIFILTFLFTVWFMDESMKQQGCCMNCDGGCVGNKLHFIKRDQPLNPSLPPSVISSVSSPSKTTVVKPSCKLNLTATPVA
jgi:hypothetical protein